MFAKLMKKAPAAPPAPAAPAAPPAPSPLLPSPWRKVSWEDSKTNLEHVRDYQPEDVPHLRVLLYGPVGAGKSSFINSVSSVVRGRIAIPAGVSAANSDKSYTKKYKTHKIRKETKGNFYPIVFNDIMGLEDGSGNGVRVEDIKLAMMGHVNDGYTFNSASALSQGNPGYNPSPSLGDQVHVLVCVHSANYAEIKESVFQKMKEIREEANDLGIPQVAVITKIGEACEETEKDLKNVYRSKHLKKKMSDFSSAVGIQLNCIFPVKNTNKDNFQDPNVDALILDALRHIIDFGDDFVDKRQVLPCPWRKETWRDSKTNLEHVRDYQPEVVPHLRVLLYGPVGAGKSSFINSISSVLQGRIAIPAGVNAATSDKSHTKKYKTYKIKRETSGNFYPIVFSDIMGLEDGSGNGVRVEDIKLAMKGHINDDYEFKPVSALSQSDPGYNPSPSLDNKVHVLVCVHSANSAEIKESVLQKMKEIREEANSLGIPQGAIMTKIDEACVEAKKDLKNVYRSEHLKKKMSDFSSALGIPMNCIFPVKNYSEEPSMDPDVDALIFDALRRIIDFGDDFLDKLPESMDRSSGQEQADKASCADPCVRLRGNGPDLPRNKEDEGEEQGGSQRTD